MFLEFLYLLIPIFIFLTFFLKSYFLIFIGVLIYVFFGRKFSDNNLKLYFKKTHIITLNSIILLFLFSTGHGGFISASGIDIPWRNAIYQDLIKYPWPVIYEYSDSALVYYITYWLVPAGISY